MRNGLVWAMVVVLGLAGMARVGQAEGLEAKGSYFPIGVWLQDPRNADKYAAIGVNVYVGLWEGPTEKQLAALEKAGMKVACEQNAEALKKKWEKVVVGWLQNDEPDNAQDLGKGKGYGPPVLPGKVVEKYQELKAGDALGRPVMLNLGQGVAWDGWYGRGVRTNKPEDYPLYVKGGDVVSFDIYPVTHDKKEVAGKLWYVGKGVERLNGWVEGKKPVWACIETTHISNEKVKPTPEQTRSEVWMAIIHGAKGVLYFAHEFAPKFVEAGLLADKPMAEKVKQINAEVQGYAKVINEGKAVEGATVTASDGEGGVAMMVRKLGEETYVFAVGMKEGKRTAALELPGMGGKGEVEVMGEGRKLARVGGKWTDEIEGYGVRVYRVR